MSVLSLLLCFGVQGVMLGWVSVEDDEVLISVWPIKSCVLSTTVWITRACAAREKQKKPTGLSGSVRVGSEEACVGPTLKLKSKKRAGVLIESMREGPKEETILRVISLTGQTWPFLFQQKNWENLFTRENFPCSTWSIHAIHHS